MSKKIFMCTSSRQYDISYNKYVLMPTRLLQFFVTFFPSLLQVRSFCPIISRLVIPLVLISTKWIKFILLMFF